MPTKMIWAGAVALALGSSASALANPFASDTVDVRTSDLDLSSARDMARLDARIARAATNVCGRSVNHLGAAVATKAAHCRAEVVSQIQEQVAGLRQAKTLASAD